MFLESEYGRRVVHEHVGIQNEDSPLAEFLLGLVVAFQLPAKYRAQAILLPPNEEGLPPLTQTERDHLRESSDKVGWLEVLETPAGLAARLLRTRPVIEAPPLRTVVSFICCTKPTKTCWPGGPNSVK